MLAKGLSRCLTAENLRQEARNRSGALSSSVPAELAAMRAGDEGKHAESHSGTQIHSSTQRIPSTYCVQRVVHCGFEPLGPLNDGHPDPWQGFCAFMDDVSAKPNAKPSKIDKRRYFIFLSPIPSSIARPGAWRGLYLTSSVPSYGADQSTLLSLPNRTSEAADLR
jgi:hypothetical protein